MQTASKGMKHSFFLACLMGLVLWVTGCGSGAVKPTAQQAHVFDNAPTAVKQAWDKALKAEQSHDYLTAQDSFKSLQKMDLTSQQRQVVNTEYLAFHHRLYQAAENGDAEAVKAVKEINAHYKR